MFTLLIDDKRGGDFTRIARTYAEGIAALQERQWDLVILDHDLGDFSGPDGRELTGNSVACWLEEFKEHMPLDVAIISSNPTGRDNIIRALSKFFPHKYVWVYTGFFTGSDDDDTAICK